MKFIVSHRFWTLWMAAAAVLFWYYRTDPNGGAETLSRLQWLAWIMVIAGPVYLLRRAFFPETRSRDAADKAMQGDIGAGLVYLGQALLTGMLFLALAGQAKAADLPPGAVKYLPLLASETRAHWPDTPLKSALAAQVEQETCASLTSKRCWNPITELKTDREYGFGLGQLTVTAKFDNFKEARKLDASLRDWAWEDRYDPARQLRTLVLMDRSGYQRLSALVPDPRQRLAMAFSAYNGGLGGVLADRRLCDSIADCDPGKWWGNVESHSLKAKTKSSGYGQSFYDINRGYVRAVLIDRRRRYAAGFGEFM